jgi:hypothetical protein
MMLDLIAAANDWNTCMPNAAREIKELLDSFIEEL